MINSQQVEIRKSVVYLLQPRLFTKVSSKCIPRAFPARLASGWTDVVPKEKSVAVRHRLMTHKEKRRYTTSPFFERVPSLLKPWSTNKDYSNYTPVRTAKSSSGSSISPIYVTKNRPTRKSPARSNDGDDSIVSRGIPEKRINLEMRKIAYKIKKDQWNKKLETIKIPGDRGSLQRNVSPVGKANRRDWSPNDLVFESSSLKALKKEIMKIKSEKKQEKEANKVNDFRMSTRGGRTHAKNKSDTPSKNEMVVEKEKAFLPSPFFVTQGSFNQKSSFSHSSDLNSNKSTKSGSKSRTVSRQIIEYKASSSTPCPRLAGSMTDGGDFDVDTIKRKMIALQISRNKNNFPLPKAKLSIPKPEKVINPTIPRQINQEQQMCLKCPSPNILNLLAGNPISNQDVNKKPGSNIRVSFEEMKEDSVVTQSEKPLPETNAVIREALNINAIIQESSKQLLEGKEVLSRLTPEEKTLSDDDTGTKSNINPSDTSKREKKTNQTIYTSTDLQKSNLSSWSNVNEMLDETNLLEPGNILSVEQKSFHSSNQDGLLDQKMTNKESLDDSENADGKKSSHPQEGNKEHELTTDMLKENQFMLLSNENKQEQGPINDENSNEIKINEPRNSQFNLLAKDGPLSTNNPPERAYEYTEIPIKTSVDNKSVGEEVMEQIETSSPPIEDTGNTLKFNVNSTESSKVKYLEKSSRTGSREMEEDYSPSSNSDGPSPSQSDILEKEVVIGVKAKMFEKPIIPENDAGVVHEEVHYESIAKQIKPISDVAGISHNDIVVEIKSKYVEKLAVNADDGSDPHFNPKGRNNEETHDNELVQTLEQIRNKHVENINLKTSGEQISDKSDKLLDSRTLMERSNNENIIKNRFAYEQINEKISEPMETDSITEPYNVRNIMQNRAPENQMSKQPYNLVETNSIMELYNDGNINQNKLAENQTNKLPSNHMEPETITELYNQGNNQNRLHEKSTKQPSKQMETERTKEQYNEGNRNQNRLYEKQMPKHLVPETKMELYNEGNINQNRLHEKAIPKQTLNQNRSAQNKTNKQSSEHMELYNQVNDQNRLHEKPIPKQRYKFMEIEKTNEQHNERYIDQNRLDEKQIPKHVEPETKMEHYNEEMIHQNRVAQYQINKQPSKLTVTQSTKEHYTGRSLNQNRMGENQINKQSSKHMEPETMVELYSEGNYQSSLHEKPIPKRPSKLMGTETRNEQYNEGNIQHDKLDEQPMPKQSPRHREPETMMENYKEENINQNRLHEMPIPKQSSKVMESEQMMERFNDRNLNQNKLVENQINKQPSKHMESDAMELYNEEPNQNRLHERPIPKQPSKLMGTEPTWKAYNKEKIQHNKLDDKQMRKQSPRRMITETITEPYNKGNIINQNRLHEKPIPKQPFSQIGTEKTGEEYNEENIHYNRLNENKIRTQPLTHLKPETMIELYNERNINQSKLAENQMGKQSSKYMETETMMELYHEGNNQNRLVEDQVNKQSSKHVEPETSMELYNEGHNENRLYERPIPMQPSKQMGSETTREVYNEKNIHHNRLDEKQIRKQSPPRRSEPETTMELSNEGIIVQNRLHEKQHQYIPKQTSKFMASEENMERYDDRDLNQNRAGENQVNKQPSKHMEVESMMELYNEGNYQSRSHEKPIPKQPSKLMATEMTQEEYNESHIQRYRIEEKPMPKQSLRRVEPETMMEHYNEENIGKNKLHDKQIPKQTSKFIESEEMMERYNDRDLNQNRVGENQMRKQPSKRMEAETIELCNEGSYHSGLHEKPIPKQSSTSMDSGQMKKIYNDRSHDQNRLAENQINKQSSKHIESDEIMELYNEDLNQHRLHERPVPKQSSNHMEPETIMELYNEGHNQNRLHEKPIPKPSSKLESEQTMELYNDRNLDQHRLSESQINKQQSHHMEPETMMELYYQENNQDGLYEKPIPKPPSKFMSAESIKEDYNDRNLNQNRLSKNQTNKQPSRYMEPETMMELYNEGINQHRLHEKPISKQPSKHMEPETMMELYNDGNPNQNRFPENQINNQTSKYMEPETRIELYEEENHQNRLHEKPIPKQPNKLMGTALLKEHNTDRNVIQNRLKDNQQIGLESTIEPNNESNINQTQLHEKIPKPPSQFIGTETTKEQYNDRNLNQSRFAENQMNKQPPKHMGPEAVMEHYDEGNFYQNRLAKRQMTLKQPSKYMEPETMMELYNENNQNRLHEKPIPKQQSKQMVSETLMELKNEGTINQISSGERQINKQSSKHMEPETTMELYNEENFNQNRLDERQIPKLPSKLMGTESTNEQYNDGNVHQNRLDEKRIPRLPSKLMGTESTNEQYNDGNVHQNRLDEKRIPKLPSKLMGTESTNEQHKYGEFHKNKLEEKKIPKLPSKLMGIESTKEQRNDGNVDQNKFNQKHIPKLPSKLMGTESTNEHHKYGNVDQNRLDEKHVPKLPSKLMGTESTNEQHKYGNVHKNRLDEKQAPKLPSKLMGTETTNEHHKYGNVDQNRLDEKKIPKLPSKLMGAETTKEQYNDRKLNQSRLVEKQVNEQSSKLKEIEKMVELYNDGNSNQDRLDEKKGLKQPFNLMERNTTTGQWVGGSSNQSRIEEPETEKKSGEIETNTPSEKGITQSRFGKNKLKKQPYKSMERNTSTGRWKDLNLYTNKIEVKQMNNQPYNLVEGDTSIERCSDRNITQIQTLSVENQMNKKPHNIAESKSVPLNDNDRLNQREEDGLEDKSARNPAPQEIPSVKELKKTEPNRIPSIKMKEEQDESKFSFFGEESGKKETEQPEIKPELKLSRRSRSISRKSTNLMKDTGNVTENVTDTNNERSVISGKSPKAFNIKRRPNPSNYHLGRNRRGLRKNQYRMDNPATYLQYVLKGLEMMKGAEQINKNKENTVKGNALNDNSPKTFSNVNENTNVHLKEKSKENLNVLVKENTDIQSTNINVDSKEISNVKKEDANLHSKENVNIHPEEVSFKPDSNSVFINPRRIKNEPKQSESITSTDQSDDISLEANKIIESPPERLLLLGRKHGTPERLLILGTKESQSKKKEVDSTKQINPKADMNYPSMNLSIPKVEESETNKNIGVKILNPILETSNNIVELSTPTDKNPIDRIEIEPTLNENNFFLDNVPTTPKIEIHGPTRSHLLMYSEIERNTMNDSFKTSFDNYMYGPNASYIEKSIDLQEKELINDYYNKSNSAGAIDTVPPNLINDQALELAHDRTIKLDSNDLLLPSAAAQLNQPQILPEHIINMDMGMNNSENNKTLQGRYISNQNIVLYPTPFNKSNENNPWQILPPASQTYTQTTAWKQNISENQGTNQNKYWRPQIYNNFPSQSTGQASNNQYKYSHFPQTYNNMQDNSTKQSDNTPYQQIYTNYPASSTQTYNTPNQYDSNYSQTYSNAQDTTSRQTSYTPNQYGNQYSQMYANLPTNTSRQNQYDNYQQTYNNVQDTSRQTNKVTNLYDSQQVSTTETTREIRPKYPAVSLGQRSTKKPVSSTETEVRPKLPATPQKTKSPRDVKAVTPSEVSDISQIKEKIPLISNVDNIVSNETEDEEQQPEVISRPKQISKQVPKKKSKEKLYLPSDMYVANQSDQESETSWQKVTPSKENVVGKNALLAKTKTKAFKDTTYSPATVDVFRTSGVIDPPPPEFVARNFIDANIKINAGLTNLIDLSKNISVYFQNLINWKKDENFANQLFTTKEKKSFFSKGKGTSDTEDMTIIVDQENSLTKIMRPLSPIIAKINSNVDKYYDHNMAEYQSRELMSNNSNNICEICNAASSNQLFHPKNKDLKTDLPSDIETDESRLTSKYVTIDEHLDLKRGKAVRNYLTYLSHLAQHNTERITPDDPTSIINADNSATYPEQHHAALFVPPDIKTINESVNVPAITKLPEPQEKPLIINHVTRQPTSRIRNIYYPDTKKICNYLLKKSPSTKPTYTVKKTKLTPSRHTKSKNKHSPLFVELQKPSVVKPSVVSPPKEKRVSPKKSNSKTTVIDVNISQSIFLPKKKNPYKSFSDLCE